MFFFCSWFPTKVDGSCVTAPPKLNPPSQFYLEGPCRELFEAVALPAVWRLSIHLKWKHRVWFIPSYTSVMLLHDDLNSVMVLLSYVTTKWIMPFCILGWLLFSLIFLSMNDHVFQMTTVCAALEFFRFHTLWIPCVLSLAWTKEWKIF